MRIDEIKRLTIEDLAMVDFATFSHAEMFAVCAQLGLVSRRVNEDIARRNIETDASVDKKKIVDFPKKGGKR